MLQGHCQSTDCVVTNCHASYLTGLPTKHTSSEGMSVEWKFRNNYVFVSYIYMSNLHQYQRFCFWILINDVFISFFKSQEIFWHIARFNTQQFYVLSTQCIYVFCVDLRTNSHYSLHSINWLVCITETECVYCAVRTECLSQIQVNYCFMVKALPHPLPGRTEENLGAQNSNFADIRNSLGSGTNQVQCCTCGGS